MANFQTWPRRSFYAPDHYIALQLNSRMTGIFASHGYTFYSFPFQWRESLLTAKLSSYFPFLGSKRLELNQTMTYILHHVLAKSNHSLVFLVPR